MCQAFGMHATVTPSSVNFSDVLDTPCTLDSGPKTRTIDHGTL